MTLPGREMPPSNLGVLKNHTNGRGSEKTKTVNPRSSSRERCLERGRCHVAVEMLFFYDGRACARGKGVCVRWCPRRRRRLVGFRDRVVIPRKNHRQIPTSDRLSQRRGALCEKKKKHCRVRHDPSP